MEVSNELDELLEGNTTEEKLNSAKEIILSLEKETSKLRAEVKKSEIIIKKLQDSSSANGLNHNNTSSAFLLPSEFKKSWEILVMENILDVFTPFLTPHSDFAFLAQTLIKYILKNVDTEIKNKVEIVYKMLGSPENGMDRVKKSLLKLFQDNCASTFPCPEIKKIGSGFLHLIPKKNYLKVKSLLITAEFEKFVKNMHNIAVNMLLNDPPLDIRFSENPEYVTVTKPDDYYCIDGFPLENPEAIIVVPCVMRNNQIYAGIKPSVLIISKNNKNNEEGDGEKIKRWLNETNKSADPYTKTQNLIYSDKFEDDQETYPPLQRKEQTVTKDCMLCKTKAPCVYCSKSTLLALARRVPYTNNTQRYMNRVQSNSLFETPSRNPNKHISTVLSRRLSEAARKMDKKCFIKNKHIDKEACKVM